MRIRGLLRVRVHSLGLWVKVSEVRENLSSRWITKGSLAAVGLFVGTRSSRQVRGGCLLSRCCCKTQPDYSFAF